MDLRIEGGPEGLLDRELDRWLCVSPAIEGVAEGTRKVFGPEVCTTGVDGLLDEDRVPRLPGVDGGETEGT